MQRVNYIFVDFENHPVTELERIQDKSVRLFIALGPKNTRLPAAFALKIHKYASFVQFIEATKPGPNAMDMVIAFEIGVQSAADPTGYFHIISRDKGFDGLVEHLRRKQIFAARRESLGEIPILMNATERLNFIVQQFKKQAKTRAARRATLESQIQVQFARTLSEVELAATIEGLLSNKFISITPKGTVTYHF